MAKPAARIAALQFALLAGLLLVIGRAGYLQLVKGAEFSRVARAQRTVTRELPARRGTIYDRNGTLLAVSEPVYRVQISVNEIRDTQKVVRLASRALHTTPRAIAALFKKGAERYPYFHGPFREAEIAPLRGIPGVRFETHYSRGYPRGRLAAAVIGAVSTEESKGQSGIERSLDSVLSGRPGETIDLRTASGRRLESPDRLIREPVPGHEVVLTIDAELQEIAENALRDAVAEFKAEGGDVVFLDPRTGELLALASLGNTGTGPTASMFTSPFEPGSTAKPFTAATLLTLGRVTDEETVSGESGRWTFVTRGKATRTIEDTHAEKTPMTLARAIQVSSNIGVAKFSQRLRWDEKYEMLRAFGFGSPTGAEYPSEASGELTRPHTWLEGYEPLSVPIGYSFNVTPIQLAAAYAVFAHDGVLLAPTLVRAIRTVDRTTLYQARPEVVRRVIPAEIAAKIREFLAEAAGDSGTGSRGQVQGGILGKTGTARKVENGRYVSGKYRSSFAAIYPAKDPQLVVVVTIDSPRGAYYGGQTAAPVTASMLQQALSARRSVIDRSGLARGVARADGPSGGRADGRTAGPADEPGPNEPAGSVRLPLVEASPQATQVLVPEVSGKNVRSAVYAVHQRGLRARVEGTGRVVARTSPSAGDSLPLGKTVVLFLAPSSRTP